MSENVSETSKAGSKFARALNYTTGTIVFGGGVPALKCEITGIEDDFVYATINGGNPMTEEYIVVPLASIVYFRYASDDE